MGYRSKAYITHLLLSPDEFAVFGHAVRFDADGTERGIAGVTVRSDDGKTCITDPYGFCVFAAKKRHLPGTVIFQYDSCTYEYPLGEAPDTDSGKS